jgi:hypothetical protein
VPSNPAHAVFIGIFSEIPFPPSASPRRRVVRLVRLVRVAGLVPRRPQHSRRWFHPRRDPIHLNRRASGGAGGWMSCGSGRHRPIRRLPDRQHRADHPRRAIENAASRCLAVPIPSSGIHPAGAAPDSEDADT